ncbi:MAG TPA: ABC transporter ATP-binding protein [Bryobacteraceae bacterium]|jgi:lipopolysaccharide transport system ATP-binding protein|nr:ABC transporter ATP-binding protein [Bryobacteraceae bacterium]
MSSAVIRVRDLGKQYRIGTHGPSYKTLRDRIASGLRFRRPSADKPVADRFWAVRNVNFDIPEGEIVGVIGRNGAGKSTLLKLISRITEPTEGEIELAGRVRSLLEVGTGFHPELTGRENIFMNGAILGMTRAEIVSKFDAIVEFAEVEKFIDTPVKHYSSGMYLRLAFAVAAHLEPEILIVDEVLAVGDAAFQKKCLGKMNEVSRQGRTVLFVSHNMVAVENLCSRGIMMDHGQIVFDGPVRDAIAMYLAGSDSEPGQDLRESSARRAGTGEARITRYEIIGLEGTLVRAGDPFTIRLHYECRQRVKTPVFCVSILTRSTLPLFTIFTKDLDYQIDEISADGFIDLQIHSPNFLAGSYILHLGITDAVESGWKDHVTDGAELEIAEADVYGSGKLRGASFGVLFYNCTWSLTSSPATLVASTSSGKN